MSQLNQFDTVALSFNSSGDNTIIAAPSAGPIKIWKLAFTTASAVNVTFKAGSTALSGAFVFGGNGSFVLYYDGSPHYICPPGSAFVINLSSGVAIGGTVWYTIGG
jgi:hypothetical protein